ncbi:hypothetical protein M0R89_20560 (plasmid) [Halorussus limi]|uniref:Uncharacterized protein n=1 Tax=Halorussus limi TaxID=2938695 RepID=A0A8U0I1F1_9EURY|nr:hypothetical protein [Halorussus limi]UPV76863.1 hypothetical protein M0R89_20560 [Halorussus limi]
MRVTRVSVVQATTVLVVAAFLGVLGQYLGRPGYTQTRLAFFAVLGGLAVAGAAGVVYRRETVAAGGACGLLLLGLWQAVLWIYIFPVVGVLAFAIAVTATPDWTDSSAAR